MRTELQRSSVARQRTPGGGVRLATGSRPAGLKADENVEASGAAPSTTVEASGAASSITVERDRSTHGQCVKMAQDCDQGEDGPVPIPASEVLDEMVVVLEELRSQGTVRAALRRTYHTAVAHNYATPLPVIAYACTSLTVIPPTHTPQPLFFCFPLNLLLRCTGAYRGRKRASRRCRHPLGVQ